LKYICDRHWGSNCNSSVKTEVDLLIDDLFRVECD
jgi:hypothetical protein